MSKPRVDIVYEAVIQRILSGEYAPGDPITRRDIATSLNVSISPVSEAFALLQGEEIIVTVSRKGTFINKLDWKELGDLIDVRAALECQAARVYCSEIIEGHKEELMSLAELSDESGDLSSEHLIADINFHRYLVRLAGNDCLSGLFDKVITRSMLLAMDATISIMTPPDETMSHRTLVSDLCRADSSKAEKIIRKHIYSAKTPLLQALNTVSEIRQKKKKETKSESNTLDEILSAIKIKAQSTQEELNEQTTL